MQCPKCQSEINENDKYCSNCGENLKVSKNTSVIPRPLKAAIIALVIIVYFLWSFYMQMLEQDKNAANAPQIETSVAAEDNNAKTIEIEHQKKIYEQKLNQAKTNIGIHEDKIEKIKIYYEKNCNEEVKRYKFVRPLYFCPVIVEQQDKKPQLMGALLYLTQDDFVPFTSMVWYIDGDSKEVNMPLDLSTKVFDYGCAEIRYFPIDVTMFDKVAKSKETIVRLKLFSSKLDYDLTEEEKTYIKNMTEFYKLLVNNK